MRSTTRDRRSSRWPKIWRAVVGALFAGALVTPASAAQDAQSSAESQAPRRSTHPRVLQWFARRAALQRMGYELNGHELVRSHRPRHRSPNNPPKPTHPDRPGHDGEPGPPEGVPPGPAPWAPGQNRDRDGRPNPPSQGGQQPGRPNDVPPGPPSSAPGQNRDERPNPPGQGKPSDVPPGPPSSAPGQNKDNSKKK